MLNALSSSTVIGYDSLSSVISAITSQVNVQTVVAVIAGIAGTCIGLVFFWWGLRKVVRMIMSAFKRGKMSV